MINKYSPKIGVNIQVFSQFQVDKNSIWKDQVRFFNFKQFIVIERKKVNESIFTKEGFCLKSSTKSLEDVKQIKKKWEEKEIMTRKLTSEIIKKPKSIETFILACYILILYFFALILAPNQFCCSKK